MTDNEDATLEALVDAYGLGAVVQHLARIAEAKAQHIQDNWQDAVTANQWIRAATRLERQVARIENLVGAMT